MKFLKLIQELDSQLEIIQVENKGIIKLTNLSVFACEQILFKFHKIISSPNFKFQDEEDEIIFFKNIKTIPLEKLIYFLELRSFELLFPKVDEKNQKKYLNKKVKKINLFFKNNLDFLHYVKEDRNDLDNIYFTRAHNQSSQVHNPFYYRSPEFSTSHDIILSKIKAFEKLLIYLKEKLITIEHPQMNDFISNQPDKKMREQI